eukprot:525394-Prymnesium_polylepis.1
MLLPETSDGLRQKVVERGRERGEVRALPSVVAAACPPGRLVRLRAMVAQLRLERLEHGVHARCVDESGILLRLATEHALCERDREAAEHARERHDVGHEPERAVLLGDEEVGSVAVPSVHRVLDHEFGARSTGDI